MSGNVGNGASITLNLKNAAVSDVPAESTPDASVLSVGSSTTPVAEGGMMTGTPVRALQLSSSDLCHKPCKLTASCSLVSRTSHRPPPSPQPRLSRTRQPPSRLRSLQRVLHDAIVIRNVDFNECRTGLHVFPPACWSRSTCNRCRIGSDRPHMASRSRMLRRIEGWTLIDLPAPTL